MGGSPAALLSTASISSLHGFILLLLAIGGLHARLCHAFLVATVLRCKCELQCLHLVDRPIIFYYFLNLAFHGGFFYRRFCAMCSCYEHDVCLSVCNYISMSVCNDDGM